ncbi:MAG: restriction endonuclease subunit S [Winogradskyella sp.]
MKRYETYKDSGIEWLGEIPKHWKINKLKFVGNIVCGGTPSTSNESYWKGEIPWIQSGKVQNNTVTSDQVDKFISEQALRESSTKVVPSDSILIAITGATCSNIGYLTFETTVNQSIIGITPFSFNTNLLFHLLKAQKEQILFHQSGGAQGGVTKGDIMNLYIPHPPNGEQTQIANYLDQKTTQIDELIAKKEQLIHLLEEERKAIINQAVTKGLNPDAPMKDSGIDWLGEIPEHWNVSQIKYVTKKIGSGVTPRGGAETYLEEGIPLLRSQNVYFDNFKLDNVAYISEDIHNDMKNSQVLKGDVLLNITGGSIGRCYYVSNQFEEANVNQHVCIVRPNEKIKTKFLHLVLSSELGQSQIELCQTGGNREALNFEQLKKFYFVLPDINDQEVVIKSIENHQHKISKTIANCSREIELLKEYKTTLISDVVTGKIDVREEVLN